MLALTPRALCLGALAVGVIACAPVPPGPLGAPRRSGSISSLTPTSRVIDAARIARLGSQSALDAVRMLVPRHRLADLGAPTPPRTGGLRSRGALRILVDRHPIFDLEALRAIPAREIMAIHILSMSDAAMRLGPGYDGGAIVVWTQAGREGIARTAHPMRPCAADRASLAAPSSSTRVLCCDRATDRPGGVSCEESVSSGGGERI